MLLIFLELLFVLFFLLHPAESYASDPDDSFVCYCPGGRLDLMTLQPFFKPTNPPRPSKIRPPFKPFKIEFVVDSNLINGSKENEKKLDRVLEKINKRLGAAIRTWPLDDPRVDRAWSGPSCVLPTRCGGVDIPLAYHKPCYDPNGTWIPEEGVNVRFDRQEGSKDGKDKPTDISLVIFLQMHENPREPSRLNRKKFAETYVCNLDLETVRPTHGRILLRRELRMIDENYLSVGLLHQMIHVMTIGHFGTVWKEPTVKLDPNDTMIHFGNTSSPSWTIVQYDDWQDATDTFVPHQHPAIISPSVVKAAQDYFECQPGTKEHTKSKFKAAEVHMETQPKTKDEAIWEQRSFGHWPQRLMPDELMVICPLPTAKLSELTLGALEVTGWYRVDMSQSESLMFNASGRRLSTSGCDIPTKSCHFSFSKVQRYLVRKSPEMLEQQAWIGTYCIGDGVVPEALSALRLLPPAPASLSVYSVAVLSGRLVEGGRAFDKPTTQHRDSPSPLGFSLQRQCSLDGRYLLTCGYVKNDMHFTDGCPILHIPTDADLATSDCHHSKQKRQSTTCLTFQNGTLFGMEYQNQSYPSCVEYKCGETGGIVFTVKTSVKLKGEDQKTITCSTVEVCHGVSVPTKIPWTHSAMDKDDSDCRKLIDISIVCPDYEVLCKNRRQNPGSQGSMESVGSARFASDFEAIVGLLVICRFAREI